ncbi:MAG: ATP-binding cassette domain-containing protein [Clostridia bacterium]|nr:ATP-binding cassette domain-containing protein [Clostridia bacterium]
MSDVLNISDLSIKINQRVIFQNISFTVREGDAVILSGANGIGKSTILKSIMRLEPEGKEITGRITHHRFGDVMELNDAELQQYRSSIAYLQQCDDYSEMGNIQVRDIMSESGEAHSSKTLNNAEVNDLIDRWLPRRKDGSRVFDAKSKPGKFSGGEQRLLSVLSVLATRPDADLLIIDEPLNNLDFNNARNISNLINKIRKENPSMGLLMVSHCRIFPFINREIKIAPEGASEVSGMYVCHSCFGDPDNEGYYQD